MNKVLLRAMGGSLLAVSLALGANFSGSVIDGSSGKPISGAIVTVGSTVTRADSKGQFHVEGCGPAVMARAYGYTRAQAPANSNGSASLQLKLTPVTPRAVYLSFWAVATASVREPVLHLAATTPVNAVVIDVKGDLGRICYRTAVPLAGSIGAQKIITVPDIRGLLDRLHNEGIYTIGRIVTFKDNALCTARPELAVHQNGKAFKDREGLTWCDPFLAEVRRYNIDVAEDAAKAGFDEIQFDYVRFPDAKGVEFSQASTEESRPKAITGFWRKHANGWSRTTRFWQPTYSDIFAGTKATRGSVRRSRRKSLAGVSKLHFRQCSTLRAFSTAFPITGIQCNTLTR